MIIKNKINGLAMKSVEQVKNKNCEWCGKTKQRKNKETVVI